MTRDVAKRHLIRSTVLGLTAAAFFLFGMATGVNHMEEQVDSLVSCTVEEYKLVAFKKNQELDEMLLAKIDMKSRIMSEVGDLRLEKRDLEFDIARAEEELNSLNVEIGIKKRSLQALNDSNKPDYRKSF